MSDAPSRLRRHAARIVAIVVVIGLYGMARMPELPAAERLAIAERFGFTAMQLEEWSGEPFQTRRDVNPSLERHSGWMSAVGAAVALADLDGDASDELYVASDKHHEVRRYVWQGGVSARETIYRRPGRGGVFTWNIMPIPVELIPNS